ncbi:MAG: hypothetical protein OEV00_02690 [Acidobacteriota bacterium]|nr:hypothetical protein [Acidobacteriota bacterium]MDH3784217.1 hypothetical protein [Acidobacteriota bacterium]
MALDKIVNEFKLVGLVTLYFAVCFGLVLTLKKLFLAQYSLEFYGVSAAIVGALVVAKVVVLLDHTRIGNRFDRGHALWQGVFYKSLMYTGVALLVVGAERIFHAYRESGNIREAMAQVWQHRDRSVMLATVLCVGLSFAAYNLYSAIDRRLGEGTLRKLLFRRP